MIKLKEHSRENHWWNFGVSIKNPQDCWNSDHCLLTASALGHFWVFRIPKIFNPRERQKSSSIGNYVESTPRSWGFHCGHTHLHVTYGIQPMSWTRGDPANSDHTAVWEYPWCRRQLVRWEYFTPDCQKFASVPAQGSWIADYQQIDAAVPKLTFEFNDPIDGALVHGVASVQEREWRGGNGAWSWLRWFTHRQIERVVDLTFDSGIGFRKESWKGGLTGISIKMLDGELAWDTIKRSAAEGFRSNTHGVSEVRLSDK